MKCFFYLVNPLLLYLMMYHLLPQILVYKIMESRGKACMIYKTIQSSLKFSQLLVLINPKQLNVTLRLTISIIIPGVNNQLQTIHEFLNWYGEEFVENFGRLRKTSDFKINTSKICHIIKKSVELNSYKLQRAHLTDKLPRTRL